MAGSANTPSSGQPAYLQIADHIRTQIVGGDFAPGSPLVSEREMIESYGASRGTVRHAIDVLVLEGLVQRRHGRGVFVATQPARRRLASARFSRAFREGNDSRGAWDAEVRAGGGAPRSELVEFGPVVAPPNVVERLRLAHGEQAMIRRREMFINDRAAQIATSYLPWSIAEGTELAEKDPGPGGIYSRLEDLGHELTRFTEEVIARPPSDGERKLLRIEGSQPVFELHRTAYAGDRPVEVCDTVVAADRFVLAYDWPAA